MKDMIKTLKKYHSNSEKDDQALDPIKFEQITADIKYTQEMIEYLGQNIHGMNNTIGYLLSNEVLESSPVGQTEQISEAQIISEKVMYLTSKLDSMQSRFLDQETDSKKAISSSNRERKEEDLKLASQIQDAADNPEKYVKVTNDDGTSYGIILICLGIIGVMCYVYMKLKEARKKHIL